jgi:hypothetical protein
MHDRDHEGGTVSTDDLTLSRRGLIGVLGGGVASVAFGARALDAFGANDGSVAACVLTPEVTEGPYWIDTKLTRYDVREGRSGLPLVLEFTIVNASPASRSRAPTSRSGTPTRPVSTPASTAARAAAARAARGRRRRRATFAVTSAPTGSARRAS